MTARTPLQEWAWHRFMFKGFLVRTMKMAEYLLYTGDLCANEILVLTSIHTRLKHLLKHWDDAQGITRTLREREIKSNGKKNNHN